MKSVSPETQLDGFLAKYTPQIAALAEEVLAKMRKRLPGAFQLVYDNYNARAIGFGPTERASDAIFSVALFPRWVSLFFLQGANLGDPHMLLQGTGKQARHILLRKAGQIEEPPVEALIVAALKSAKRPIDGESQEGCLIIKSVSAKQRPRRPAKASRAA